MRRTPETIVLLNFGCEDIQKIARAVRERYIYTLVMPYTVSVERLTSEMPSGAIVCMDRRNAKRNADFIRFAATGLPMLLTDGAAGFAALPEGGGMLNCSSTDIDAMVDFCIQQCGCKCSWRLDRFVDEAVADIRKQVGNAKVILGLSGGVDSAVAAALIHRAIGRRLHCVFVDHGLLRKNEPELVREVFERNFDMNLCCIDASERFLTKLEGVSDPEEKRKVIGKEFIEVFAEAAAKIDAPFLGQGTIYPDVLESTSMDGNPKGIIKSHHNVGGLPENLKFKLVEPLERLFKDEVRAVGRLLGLPSEVLDRHPFPGPSLGVRHIGAIRRETLALLREADAIVIDELRKSGWYAKTWQTFAIFVPVQTVGIRNGERAYEYTIAIRSINSVDAVTAQIVRLPWDLLETMAQRIVAEVPGISRVVYDITSKPPATIEWE